MDSLVLAYDSLVPYPLSEHLIVRANSWIIDSLAETDYYLQKEKAALFTTRPACQPCGKEIPWASRKKQWRSGSWPG
ncbi:MAG: hypothetical protein IPN74_10420 [Haliscomenobacter sp.]|nr:hypothetical protein [Haliscomenobacter sp.]